MGILDRMTADAGRGLSDMINGFIHKVGSVIDAGIGKIAGVTESAVAGVSGIMDKIGDVANGFTVNGPSEGLKIEPPMTANRMKELQMASAAVDTSGYGVNFNDVVAPTIGSKGPSIDQGRFA